MNLAEYRSLLLSLVRIERQSIEENHPDFSEEEQSGYEMGLNFAIQKLVDSEFLTQ